MKTLTNIEISRIYKVSHVTVGNWIKLAIEKKNELEIEKKGNKFVILDTFKNRKEMELLATRGSKFRNSVGYKKVEADPRLYEIFSESNLIELFTELDSKKIVPLKFTYCDGGADLWRQYTEGDLEDPNYSYFKEEIDLFISNIGALLPRFRKYKKINLVDIGPGTGYLASKIISKFLKEGFEITYRAIDISQDMLNIVESNFKKWFPNLKITTEVNDFDYMITRDLLFKNKDNDTQSACNLILFIGDTIGNALDRYRVLRNFYDSMYKDDFLFMNATLKFFGQAEHAFGFLNRNKVVEQSLWIPNLLGIEDADYNKNIKINEKLDCWVLNLTLNKNIDISVKIKGKEYITSVFKDEEITVYNWFNYSFKELNKELVEVGLLTVHLAVSQDNFQALLLCQPDKATNLI